MVGFDRKIHSNAVIGKFFWCSGTGECLLFDMSIMLFYFLHRLRSKCYQTPPVQLFLQQNSSQYISRSISRCFCWNSGVIESEYWRFSEIILDCLKRCVLTLTPRLHCLLTTVPLDLNFTLAITYSRALTPFHRAVSRCSRVRTACSRVRAACSRVRATCSRA